MYYCLDEFISRIFSLANCARDSQLFPKLTFLLENHFPQQRLKIPKVCFPRLLCSKNVWPSCGQWELRSSLIKEVKLCLLGSILFPVKIEMCEDLRWEMFSHVMIRKWWARKTDSTDSVESTLKQYTSNEVHIYWIKEKEAISLHHFYSGILLPASKNYKYIYVYIYNYDHSMYKILCLLFVT